jgi:hypothetical protein
MSLRTTFLLALAGLLAVAGVATAQECPECDEDGEPGTSGSYSSVDFGYVADDALYLVDTDTSVSEEDDPKGFWAWLSVCVTVLVDCFEEILGFDTGYQSNADLYVSEHGIDLDASARLVDPACDLAPETCTFDFDESEVGHLDDETWRAGSDAHALLGEDAFTEGAMPFDPHALDGVDVDECVQDEGHLAPC